jgi:hypothetical protein
MYVSYVPLNFEKHMPKAVNRDSASNEPTESLRLNEIYTPYIS